MKLQVRNIEGLPAGEMDVRDDVFGVPEKTDLVHQVMVAHLANKRQGTVKTKNRSEVSGGGAKPRPQKHTGRSRQGTIRSPIWVGGGRAFGPTPRSYRQRTPKKMRRLATLSVLSNKAREGRLVVLDNLDIADGKTKSMKAVIDALDIGGSVLVVTDGVNSNIIQASKNIRSIKTLPAKVLNTLDLLSKSNLVMTTDAVRRVEDTWGGLYRSELRQPDLSEENVDEDEPVPTGERSDEHIGVFELSDQELIQVVAAEIEPPTENLGGDISKPSLELGDETDSE